MLAMKTNVLFSAFPIGWNQHIYVYINELKLLNVEENIFWLYKSNKLI